MPAWPVLAFAVLQPRDLVLPTYRFDKLDTDESMVIDHWSYLWAAFAGPLYVLSKGLYLLSMLMLPITLLIAALAFLGLLVCVRVFDSSIAGLVAMVVTLIGAFLANAVAAIELVRWGYLRRGWRMGY